MNLLGTPLGMMPGYSTDTDGGLKALLEGRQNMTQPMQQPQQMPQQGKPGFLNILGQISDIISESRGAPASYAMSQERMNAQQQAEQLKQQQAQAQNALARWLQNPDDQAAFTQALLADPGRAKMMKDALQGDAYTLGEGQVRYQGGKEIARGPESLDVQVIDGVAFNKRTGEPLYESPYERVIPGPDGSFYTQPRIGFGRQKQQTPANTPAPQTNANGMPSVLTDEQYQAVVNAKGQAETDAWAQRNGVVVTKNVGGQTFYKVNGRWYDNPEGR